MRISFLYGTFLTGAASLVACNTGNDVVGGGDDDDNKVELPYEQPNIIIVYSDDMGIGDLTCYGNNGWAQTPNIDKIASEGLMMKQYYSTAAVSSPSRASLMTGRFPLDVQINTYLSDKAHNKKAQQHDFLNPTLPTLADALRDAGYATGHFGKWHLGGGRDVTAVPQITEYGFDEYVSTYESPDPDPQITGSNWIWSQKDPIPRWERTKYFIEKTLDFIERNKGEKPCFINLWPDDMHDPYIADASDYGDSADKKKSKGNFLDVLKTYDEDMGLLMRGLEDLGVTENTLIIFTSDNGPGPNTYDQLRTNSLQGAKMSLHEGGLLMPMIIHWPAQTPAGVVDESSLMSAADILPTLCAVAGAKVPRGVLLRGEDMSDVFFGKPMTRTKDIMWEHRGNLYGQIYKEYETPQLAIRRGDLKLFVDNNGSNVELYDIVKDPMENNNLANDPAHTAHVQSMSQMVIHWWETRPTL